MRNTRHGSNCPNAPAISRCRQSLTVEALGWTEFSLCLLTLLATCLWLRTGKRNYWIALELLCGSRLGLKPWKAYGHINQFMLIESGVRSRSTQCILLCYSPFTTSSAIKIIWSVFPRHPNKSSQDISPTGFQPLSFIIRPHFNPAIAG